MIGNISGHSNNQPLSSGRAERAQRLDQALDDVSVKLPQLSPSQLAANREYGMRMLDDIAAARFLQPAGSQSAEDFQALAARLQ